MVKSMNSYISGLMKTLGQNLGYLNDNKFFAGLVMIMLNIGSKYITIDLSKTQEQYLRNGIARQLLIFSISWMGSRDILVSLILTAVFNILTMHLFNENSSLCIIPKEYRVLHDLIDTNKDNKISEEELKKAEEILNKYYTQQNGFNM
tara:strand:+ start:2838 stop:3281 length:444 start_codon:yes stop_codon:yes gene_type:complete